MPNHPALYPLELRQRNDRYNRLYSSRWPDNVGYPWCCGKSFSDGVGGSVDVQVDKLGNIVGVATDVPVNASELEWPC